MKKILTEKEEIFDKAQEYETNWWVRHIKNELKPTSRDWMVGYQDHVGRGHIARFGLNADNRFWTLNPPCIDGSIMDLGSGIVSFFEGKEMDVIAVEPSLGRLKKHFPELVVIGQSRNVFYHAGEIYDYRHNAVENVWCCNMLDHTPDWVAILDIEIPRVLKENGRLFLSVDCRNGNVKMDAGHLTAFSPGLLSRHLEKNFVRIWSSPARKGVDFYRWDYIGVAKSAGI